MPSDGIGYASVLLHVSSMITDLPSCVAAICCFGFSCSSSDLLIPAYAVFRNLMLPLSFSCIFDTILLLVFFIKAIVDQSFRYFTTQSINSFKSSKVAVVLSLCSRFLGHISCYGYIDGPAQYTLNNSTCLIKCINDR
jgi:hypothetical protein